MNDDMERDITRMLDTCEAVKRRAEKRGMKVSEIAIVKVALAVERRQFERAMIDSLPRRVKELID